MKAHFHKVPSNYQNCYSIRHDIKAHFGNVWHYHPELELHYVIKGEGVRFIGDNISNFEPDELIFMGANLPHTWRCNDKNAEGDQLQAEALVMHFLPECLGKTILRLPEAFAIPKLFEKAKNGLLILGETKREVIKLMRQAVGATDLDRILILINLLKVLAETEEFETIIANKGSFHQSNEAETERINKIYAYTLANFKNDIKLEDVASLSNLSVTSFCRYFKLITKKTYYDFLLEIRVSHACRYLIENKLPTEVICFDCGFNNVSNFYRHFKKITGVTPLDYKRKFLG